MFKIIAKRNNIYQDLIDEYEIPQINPCPIKIGSEFMTDGNIKPEGLCDSAWETILPFIESIKNNKPIFKNWMKDESKAIISCNDGFRPVTFLIERID